MASSKVMKSSNSRKLDMSRRSSSASSSSRPSSVSDRSNGNRGGISRLDSSSTMSLDSFLRDIYSTPPATEATLVDASITLIDNPAPIPSFNLEISQDQNLDFLGSSGGNSAKIADDVWREMVSGVRKEVAMKMEAPDETMTLEDFLARNGEMDDVAEAKVESESLSGGVYSFDPVAPNAFDMLDKMEGSIVGLGNEAEMNAGTGGRKGKRGRGFIMETQDRAALQRQKRMIKNRESAARSRERKQAYQVELESLVVKLEEENEQLLKEKAERTKERYKQLIENVIPVDEQRRPSRRLCRCNSF